MPRAGTTTIIVSSLFCRYYQKVFPSGKNEGVAVLDMCSSWISHYPANFQAGKIVGAWWVSARLLVIVVGHWALAQMLLPLGQ